jgi:integrase
MRYTVPALGDPMLKDITRDSLTELRRERSLEHRVLGSLLSYAVAERGVLESNPARASRSRPTRGAVKEARHLDKDEARRLLDVATSTDIESAVALGLLGVRVSEVCGLVWGDVRTTTRKDASTVTRLHVERQFGGGPTKSGKPRSLVLSPETVARLDRCRIRQAEELLMFGVRQEPTTPIVRFHPHTVQSKFKALADEHGFDASFHTLRHTAAVALLSSGVDVVTAAGRLGHTPAVLLKVYAHFIPSADEAAAEAVEKWFVGTGT